MCQQSYIYIILGGEISRHLTKAFLLLSPAFSGEPNHFRNKLKMSLSSPRTGIPTAIKIARIGETA